MINLLSKKSNIGFGIILSLLFFSCTQKPKFDNYNYHQSFEELKGWFDVPPTITAEIIAHSGAYSALTNEIQRFSPTLRLKFYEIEANKPKRVKASVWCYSTDISNEGSLCFELKNEANEVQLWVVKSLKDAGVKPFIWTRIDLTTSFTKEKFSPNNQIGVFFWNTGKGKVYVDDFSFEVIRGSY
ncbi:MAG TPA: hypothetical protein PLI68_09625 [Bacteroidia bacterium]|nr:hypothetical protein [Bacteroidia bacterium]HRH07105.1 hypothetical protein [Bacteroidia bacterium]HRH63571.1 hypothetical protein [Bacteroidia bacterium]